MSGCYRCGMPDGSDSRLCEMCFCTRFHRQRDVIEIAAGTEVEGLEFSPSMKKILLGSGAMLYVSLLTLFIAIHIQQQPSAGSDPRLEFYPGESQVSIRVESRLGAVRVSR